MQPPISITTNQASIAALLRVINRYVGNLPPMPGLFPDDPAPVVRNTDTGRELAMMRWGRLPLTCCPTSNIRSSEESLQSRSRSGKPKMLAISRSR